MDHQDHVALLRPGVPEGGGGTWADLGSGHGAFTLALAELLGPGATIVSVDRDGAALHEQERLVGQRYPAVDLQPVVADFTAPLVLPPLDGIVMANSLHFVRDKPPVLGRLIATLVPGGRFLLVEYDADRGNPWVPHPLSVGSWQRLAASVDLQGTHEIGRRPSRFLGAIYSALSIRP